MVLERKDGSLFALRLHGFYTYLFPLFGSCGILYIKQREQKKIGEEDLES
jgi:hypothetical protein